MGFSPNPPRATVQDVLQGIDLWSPRAEVVIIHEELPWARLLAGHAPDTIIDEDKQGLVDQVFGRVFRVREIGERPPPHDHDFGVE